MPDPIMVKSIAPDDPTIIKSPTFNASDMITTNRDPTNIRKQVLSNVGIAQKLLL
jgi:hypothetical protein